MSTEHHSNEKVDYTDKDIRVRALFISLMVSLVFTGVTFVGIKYMFNYLKQDASGQEELLNKYSADRQIPESGPVLQDAKKAVSDLKELHAQEDALLNHYEWVDKNSGVVRIPVDQAMTRIVEKGLPARE